MPTTRLWYKVYEEITPLDMILHKRLQSNCFQCDCECRFIRHFSQLSTYTALLQFVYILVHLHQMTGKTKPKKTYIKNKKTTDILNGN